MAPLVLSQAPELTDEAASVLYNGFKADTYSLGKAFLLLVGDEYEAQGADSEAVRDMDLMFGMTLQPEPEDRATSVEVMEFTRQKELEAIERWREKEDEKLQEMVRASPLHQRDSPPGVREQGILKRKESESLLLFCRAKSRFG